AKGSESGGFNFDFSSSDPNQTAEAPDSLARALGGVFKVFDNLGPSGQALGQVFSMMFANIMNISTQDKLIDGVYTFNATFQDTENWSESYDGNLETYWIWKEDYPTPGQQGQPYAVINRTGSANITHTYGSSAVFIIWDNDASFITAIQKVIDAFQHVKHIMEQAGDPDQWTEQQQAQVASAISSEILSAVSYLLIHINDILNGDELLILNLITWDTFNMSTSPDYNFTKEFRVYDNDGNMANDPLVNSSTIDTWRQTAIDNKDDYMLWLLNQNSASGSQQRQWSRFSFDLVELWIKNFEIHINASAIINELTKAMNSPDSYQEQEPFEDMGLADIFQGLDIDLYFMSHSLKGFIAYNDTDSDGKPSVHYTSITEDNVTSDVITDSEAKYWFALGNIGGVKFNDPALTSDGKAIRWSIELQNPEMAAIPIGLSPKEVNPIMEHLSYIRMGFTFMPKLKEVVSTEGYATLKPDYQEVQMAAGLIKLDQAFSEWNDGSGPHNANITGLDFSVVFISTIVHFHVNFEVNKIDEQQQHGLLNESTYDGHGYIKVGRETGDLPVAAIDIAGPKYQQVNGPSTTEYNASTTTIPLAFFDFDAKSHATHVETQKPNKSFEANAFLNISSSIMIYAVNYPTWDGSGDGLIHDPTFSVFMTWNNPGFWAVILVIGGITLVAVAAIMITKRKNRI
ncbi:MAG: hypothetical protein ACTSU2_15335, partial [Promethearchaeota archaeon]